MVMLLEASSWLTLQQLKFLLSVLLNHMDK